MVFESLCHWHIIDRHYAFEKKQTFTENEINSNWNFPAKFNKIQEAEHNNLDQTLHIACIESIF
jgi:hypothetical protein